MEQFVELFSNVANFTWQQLLMIAIGATLIYLAIKKEMEPTLLLPMGFGAILVNLPFVNTEAIETLFNAGIATELFPLLLFIGIGAVAGATEMLVDPSGKAMGMAAMLPYFQVLPFAEYVFQDFVFSGIALLIVNGLSNLTAAGLLFARKKAGVILGGVFGVTLMLWICIQFVIFPLNVMSTLYFIFGLAQACTGYAAYVFLRQESFSVDTAKYKNIGRDKTRLVVYFSRMGYTKRTAYEAADALGANIYEIKATERTEGTLGFWWCGRYGMHRWPMPSWRPSVLC